MGRGQGEETVFRKELTETVGRGQDRDITDTFVISVEASRICLLTKGEMQGHRMSTGRTTLQGGEGGRGEEEWKKAMTLTKCLSPQFFSTKQ